MTKNKHGLSRDIPKPMMREVRKRCGFGCVICGGAIIRYDHFAPEFAHAREHDPSGITLLCSDHHTQKDHGLLTNEQIARFNSDPFALRRGFSSESFTLDLAPEIVMGRISFAGSTSVIRMDGVVILGFKPPEDEHAPPRLSLRFSDRNGDEFFAVVDNEIVCENQAYDIESSGRTWTVRSGRGSIDLKLTFDLPTRITVEKLNFRRPHWGLIVDGPNLELTFDGKRHSSVLAPAKIVGPWLFDLNEDSPDVALLNLKIARGSPPFPLGSVPKVDGFTFKVTWPVCFLFDHECGTPVTYQFEGVKAVGLFLRRNDADKAANESSTAQKLTIEQTHMLLEFAAEKLDVEGVLYNPDVEPMPIFHELKDICAEFGFSGTAKRNGKCFCGSNKRYKKCHGI